MNFAFRTDASTQIGSGHVMRCLTLASALREKGHSVHFISREHDGHLCDLISAKGFPVSGLEVSETRENKPAESLPAHQDWLGSTWEDDARQTKQTLGDLAPIDWLIVDHYALDARWESSVRADSTHIMVIDDLADRQHDCDILLDQNLVANLETRYADKVSDSCVTLLGPQYALLQPEYAELRDRIPPREGKINRILIFFGGVDSKNLTGMALSACLEMIPDQLQLDIVISKRSPNYDLVFEQTRNKNNCHIYSELPSLAPLMAKADLAIGAAGSTSWERLCLGLPALVVSIADNQIPIAEGLAAQNLAQNLGKFQDVDQTTLESALRQVLDTGSSKNASLHGQTLVDGRGADRLVAALTTTGDSPLHARHAALSDEDLLLRWANEPATRANSFNSDPIQPSSHSRWFHERLRKPDECKIYIIETESQVPIGQVRFELRNGAWIWHFSLASEFRRNELARPLLHGAISKLRKDENADLLINHMQSGNGASQHDFVALGCEQSINPGEARSLNITICSDATTWMNEKIPELVVDWVMAGHRVTWTHDSSNSSGGDLCFYLSYGRIVNRSTLKNFINNLVVHGSDLPKGRGWSPLTWDVLQGSWELYVSIIEAEDEVDSGNIYGQSKIHLNGTELIHDLRNKQAKVTLDLCRSFAQHYPESAQNGRPQAGTPSYHIRRGPEDSKLNIGESLESQFNLLRVCDYERYPAWFEFSGKVFKVFIERE